MDVLLDTSVAIELRDNNPDLRVEVASFEGTPLLSVVSVVELHGGINRDPKNRETRAALLEAFLASVTVLDFGAAEAEQYARIVAAAGYSRRKLLDRMIAAQALVARATLATMSPDDFADVPGLTVRGLRTA